VRITEGRLFSIIQEGRTPPGGRTQKAVYDQVGEIKRFLAQVDLQLAT